MSLILGPSTPPTFPVLILRWANDSDLGQRFLAASAALLQLALVAGAMLLWWLGERMAVHLLRPWVTGGRRDWPRWLAYLGWYAMRGVGIAALGATTLSLMSLLLWSVAQTWRYPALIPDTFSLAAWQRAMASLWGPLGNSLALAILGTALAVILALACLEHEKHLRGDVVRKAEKWLFLPLVVPEVSFLIGIQIVLFLIGLNGGWFAVAWLHLLFIFPYVFLTLKEPWRAFDPRYERMALALGQSPWRVFWRVKLPLLRGAIAWAAAIGCSVSLSLYLPTVLGGEGRIVTLASEALALSAGGDRRIVGVYGIVQSLLAAVFFIVALLTVRQRRWRSA
jgi:putative thiamine transport system permease protein